MRIKKSELAFLKHYKELASDAKTFITLELKGNTLTAYQKSDMAVMVKQIQVDNESNEEFESILPAKTFVDLIEKIKSEEIDIQQNKVSFNNGRSSYPFPVENDIVIRSYNDYLDLLKESPEETLNVSDLSLMSKALPFVSDSREGNSIGLMNGKFFARAGQAQVAVIETLNSKNTTFYFDGGIVPFISNKVDSLTIKTFPDLNTYHFVIDGIDIFTGILDAKNHFSVIEKGGLNGPLAYEASVEVNRKELLQILQRASIILSEESIIMITFQNDSIKIAPMDANSEEMSDFCEAKVDSNLVDVTFPTTIKKVASIISDRVFKDDTITLRYEVDKIPMLIHNEDEQGNRKVLVIFSREKV